MSEKRYICPYCSEVIEPDQILFWEAVKTQYTDNIRGDFLSRHGVRVSAGNKFNRMYYRVKPGENVTRADENGFPTVIEDHLGNAIAPEDLSRSHGSHQADSFDDDFDSDSFDDGMERRNERANRQVHGIPSRACPHCHCDLPLQFGVLKTFHVAMFGGRASGKTAYLVNLFQQLNTQLSNNRLGSVDLASESDAFIQPLIKEYEETGTLPPTPRDSLMPIVCHYRNGGQEAFIVFYDIAGEGTADAAYVLNHKGIQNCESLLLMIDPNMFVGGAYYKQWNANHESVSGRFGDGDCCKEPLDSYLNRAGMLCKEYGENIKTVVCVITKLDMLLEANAKFFSSGDIELLSDAGNKHKGAVDLSVLHRVSENLSVYLYKEHNELNLKQKMHETFGSDMKICILGVSTSTRVTGNGHQIRFEPKTSALDSKHRIIEPFLVVLMYCGLIPANKDGKIRYFNGEDRKEEPPAIPAEPPVKPEKHGWHLFRRKNK